MKFTTGLKKHNGINMRLGFVIIKFIMRNGLSKSRSRRGVIMNMYLLIVSYFMATVIFVYGFFLQNISQLNKKALFYGVRIPVGYESNEKLVFLHKKYQRNLLLSFLVFMIMLTLVIIFGSEEIVVALLVPETFLSLAVIAVNYLAIHKRIKRVRIEEKWTFDKNVVIIDTSYRNNKEKDERITISLLWFVIPLCILGVTIIGIIIKAIMGYPAEKYNLLDEGLPVLILVIIQVIMNIIFFLNHIITKSAKQTINGGKIGEIRHNSRRIRYMLSGGLLIMDIYINLFLMLIVFSMSSIISPLLMTFSLPVSIFVPVILSAVFIIVISKTMKEEKYIIKSDTEEQVVNRNDDKHYLFGSLYYNDNDPALFVEKRVGIGFTLNFAKPAAKIFMGVITLIVIGAFVLLAFLPGMTSERQVEVSRDLISISGTWGTDIRMEQIENVTIKNELPVVLMKTNGADIGNKLYGHHKLKGYNDALLFIGDQNKPHITINLINGKIILINYEDEVKTELLYQKIINNFAEAGTKK